MIRDAVNFLCYDSAGGIWEVRCLKEGPLGTISGYFEPERLDELAKNAAWLSEEKTRNGKPGGRNLGAVYLCMNPADPRCLSRCCNRVDRNVESTTGDDDVICRRWILIDFDPKRPANTTASDAEHALALTRASDARDWILKRWGVRGALCDSGNGGHVLLRCQMPNDAKSETKVKKLLQLVAGEFSRDAVDVDQSVSNAARLTKLYGTMARKGDAVPHQARFYRRSRILEKDDGNCFS